MIDLVKGKITGTLEIPWDAVPMRYLFEYSGIDFTKLTPDEIMAMTSASESTVRTAARNAGITLRPNPRKRKTVHMDTQTETIVRRIRMGMHSFDEDEEKLAKAIGVTKSAVYKWLEGQKRPSNESFKKMANHFRVPEDYLKGISNNSEK